MGIAEVAGVEVATAIVAGVAGVVAAMAEITEVVEVTAEVVVVVMADEINTSKLQWDKKSILFSVIMLIFF